MSALRAADLGLIPTFTEDLFPGRVILVTEEQVLQWLPCMPGTWHYRVSTRIGWPSISNLQLLFQCGSTNHFLKRSFTEIHYHLVGLVVKVSASKAEDPGFKSCLCQDLSGVESYQSHKNWHSSDYPASVWHYRVSTGTVWSGVSIL